MNKCFLFGCSNRTLEETKTCDNWKIIEKLSIGKHISLVGTPITFTKTALPISNLSQKYYDWKSHRLKRICILDHFCPIPFQRDQKIRKCSQNFFQVILITVMEENVNRSGLRFTVSLGYLETGDTWNS